MSVGCVWDGEQSLLVLLPHDEHLQRLRGRRRKKKKIKRGRGQTKGLHLREGERGIVGTPVCVQVSGYILTDKLPNDTFNAHTTHTL